MPFTIKPSVLENCISVKDAAKYSGYSRQYLRRLLRQGNLTGTKIGQVWLIKLVSIQAYMIQVEISKDNRFGPKSETQLR